MNAKIIKFIILFGLMLIILLFYYQNRNSALYAEDFLRIRNLKRWYKLITRYKTSENNFNLYQILLSGKSFYWPIMFLPSQHPNNEILNNYLVNSKDRKLFYKLCHYRLLIDKESKWWAVLEKKKGRKGKYYYMITKENKIYRLMDAEKK